MMMDGRSGHHQLRRDANFEYTRSPPAARVAASTGLDTHAAEQLTSSATARRRERRESVVISNKSTNFSRPRVLINLPTTY